MTGVRLDRLLASTAVALFLSAAPVAALAGPMSNTAAEGGKALATPVNAGSAATLTPEPLDSPNLPPVRGAAAETAPDVTGSVPASPAPAATMTNETPAPMAPPPQAPAPAAVVTPQTPAAPAAATPPAPAAASVPTPQAPAAASVATPEAPAAAPAAAATPAPAPQPDETAAKPAAPAENASNAADAAIADQLHALSSGKFDKIIGAKKDRVMIDAFYSGRNYAPLWIVDGKASEQAKAAITYLHHVDADGLDPADYPVPDFAALKDPADLAEADLRLSMAVITYAHHAAVGRVHWSRVSADISYENVKAPEPADVLASMIGQQDTAAALDSYEPQMPQYKALKEKLAELRAGKSDPSKPQIASGPAPKIGEQDDRVPALRDRLGVPGDGNYD